MFKFFKEKIGNWTKKVSKEKEVEEIPQEELGKLEEKEKTTVKKPKKKESSKKSQEKPKTRKEEKPEVKEEFVEPSSEKISEAEETPMVKEKSFFKKITGRIGKTKISEDDFSKYEEDLSLLLLENNVAFEVSEKIITRLREEIVDKEISKKELEQEIKNSLKKIIGEILIEPFDILEKIKSKEEKPFVILFAGVNGTGKTTTIAKLTNYLKKNKISCVLAAGDTFRAASIEQLKKHGENLKTNVIAHQYNSDPAAVGFDAIKYAKKNNIDVVLMDTAGRMHTSKNLLKEIEKISRVCNPDVKIFIGESITGNDAVEQAKGFSEAIGIDGIILTKADVDEKGGTALSVGEITKKPILFLGVGQGYDNIEPFDKEKFIEKIGLE